MTIGGTGNEPDLKALLAAATSAALRFNIDPDDAAQQAVIELPRDHPNPEAFVRQRAAFRSIDNARRRARQVPTDPDDLAALVDYGLSCPDPATIAEARLRVRAIFELASTELTPDQYTGLQALLSAGGSVADAVDLFAAYFGKTPSTMRTHIDRAVAKMKAAMEVGDDD
jgi:DNA-directed RNA polymerase specialized sigma24 family protein